LTQAGSNGGGPVTLAPSGVSTAWSSPTYSGGTGPGNGSVAPQAQPASEGRSSRTFSRLSIFAADSQLLVDRHGQLLIADKNYYGHQFKHDVDQAGLRLLRPTRKGERHPGPGSGSSNHSAKPSSRSSTRRRGSLISNTTVGTPSPVLPSACISACSPLASGGG